MLTADSVDFTTAAVAVCDPPTVDVGTSDGGCTCGLIAVDPAITATSYNFPAPWLTYAEQGDGGFLIVHISGNSTDGMPQVTMDIAAIRFNNTDPGNVSDAAAFDSLFTQPDGSSSADGDTCVFFDALQDNPQPISLDAVDSPAPIAVDGSFDLYMVVQSKSDATLGLWAFVIAFAQGSTDGVNAGDTPQDGGSVAGDDSQMPTSGEASLGAANGTEMNSAGAESPAQEPLAASASLVPPAPNAPLDPSLVAAASLGVVWNGAVVETQQPTIHFASLSTGNDPRDNRLSASSPVQQTQPFDHDEESNSARDTSVDQSRRTTISIDADSSLAEPLRPAISADMSAEIGTAA